MDLATQKLAMAEENVRKLSDDAPNAAEKLLEMERQNGAASTAANRNLIETIYLAAEPAELDVELEHTGTELQTA